MSRSGVKISLDRVIGNVMGNLGLKKSDDSYDDFARWACDAETKIGSTSSYKRFECELTIRNRKAALPKNFAYLNAIKYGGKIVPTTKRSFRLFNKGPKAILPEREGRNFVSGNKVTNIPGVPIVIRVDLSGAFILGDVIAITIATNNCGGLSTNTFTYIVQSGDSLTSIAASIDSQINAIQNLGYSSSPSNDSFIITGDTPDVIITLTLFTDSTNGSLSQTITQKRVPTKINTPTHTDNSFNPTTTSNNLASSSVVKLNTGINKQGPQNSVYGNGYSFDQNEQVYSIDNGCINFNVYDDEKIGVSYMGIDLDDNGFPLISETHEDAVTSYLMYMYKAVEYYNGKIPKHVFDTLQYRWFDLCGQARGDDEMPDSEEMKYLSNMWMQIMPPPSKEIF